MFKYKDHDGTVIEGGYPSDVNENDVVEVVFRNGEVSKGLAYFYEWTHIGPTEKDGDVDIVAYYVDKELEVLTSD
jgi:hypothetical protein